MRRTQILDITVARMFKVVCPFVFMNNRIDFLDVYLLQVAFRWWDLLVLVFCASMVFLHVEVGLCSCRVAS